VSRIGGIYAQGEGLGGGGEKSTISLYSYMSWVCQQHISSGHFFFFFFFPQKHEVELVEKAWSLCARISLFSVHNGSAVASVGSQPESSRSATVLG
jgi:hypothetical protein